MKTILSLVMAVVVLGLAQGNSWAGSRIIATYIGISNVSNGIYGANTPITAGTTVEVNTRAGLIYNITANATSANGECDIYDQTSTTTTGVIPIYEVKVATSGDSRSVDMNGAPLTFYNGLVVGATNATCYLNFQG